VTLPPVSTSLLLSFPFFTSFFLLLFLRRLDAVSFLQFTETQGVGHQRLIGSSLLLFDSQERILADFGCNITRCIRILNGDEVLMRGTNLKRMIRGVKPVHNEKRFYLFILGSNQNLVDAFLTQEVIFQVILVLTGS
jgi:hypothetical protein